MSPRSTKMSQEFIEIPIFKMPFREESYVEGVPPLSEFLQRAEAQLEKILKPRPFVLPIVRRKRPSTVAITSSTQGKVKNALDSVPTNCQTRADIAHDAVDDLVTYSPSLVEDLEGIADIAQETPLWSTAHERNPATNKQHRRLTTARKSTALSRLKTPPIRKLLVKITDLKHIRPAQTELLLKEYYESTNVKSEGKHSRKRRRSESTDSGHATDEPEEVVPPLKIRLPGTPTSNTVHDILGKVAIRPLQRSPVPTALNGRGSAAIPSGNEDLKSASPADGNTRDRLKKVIRRAIEIPIQRAPLKGMPRNRKNIRSEKSVARFLSSYQSDASECSAIALPTNVIQTAEWDGLASKVVPLNIVSRYQKEIDLPLIQPYPLVCIQCNVTFPTKPALSTHALVANHVSMFSY